MDKLYFGAWLFGMVVFKLDPVTSAQGVGALMVIHLVVHIISEWDDQGSGEQSQLRFGSQDRSFDDAARLDDEEQTASALYLQALEDEHLAKKDKEIQDKQLWSSDDRDHRERF